MRLTLHHTLPTAVTPSPHVLRVAAMFGLGVDAQRTIEIVPPITLRLSSSQVVFITGASGGGKSTLLRLIEREVQQQRAKSAGGAIPGVLRFDALPEPADRPLVDVFGDAPLERVLRWLSLAGLNDAFVMLRRPCELSDGQRYRLRLAMTMARVEGSESMPAEAGTPRAVPGALPGALVLADEFGATLDRITAKVVARNAAKWARQAGVCLIVATTHDDLLEALRPDVLIEKGPGGEIDIVTREEAERAHGS